MFFIIFNRHNLLSILGGLVFLGFFWFGYTGIDNHWYEYRDDGVITMSVAKNWVDYGFMGVSVSGPSVESSSSPLQVFLYASAYALFSLSYDTYAYVQTMIATFLLGAIFIRFFTHKPLFALLVTIVSAFSLTQFYHFFEWHASGMENALSHVLFLSTAYILYTAIKKEQIHYTLAIVVFLATIARLDSVYHITFILIIFSLYWHVVYKNFKALYFSLIVFILWFALHLWRYYYFGDVLPNTAYAQNISMVERLTALISLDKIMIRESMNLGREIFLNHAGWLLLSVIPLFYFTKKSAALGFLILMTFSLAITSYLNPFLFGPTRLDHSRSTTQLILLIFLLIMMLFYAIKSLKVRTILVVLFLPPALWYYMQLGYHSKPLCCSTKVFDKTRLKIQEVAQVNDIHRATVSTPDLGILSWHKVFNIVDLGKLGSPIMTHIKGSKTLIRKYYLEYALPDIIEIHDGYSCGYAFLLKDEKFKDLYYPLETKITSWTKKNCKNAPESQSGIWIRKAIQIESSSVERKFLDDLQDSLKVTRIIQELDDCHKSKRKSCLYIARTVYHFLPEIRDENKYNKVIEYFILSNANAYDMHLLQGWENALSYKKAIQLLRENRL